MTKPEMCPSELTAMALSVEISEVPVVHSQLRLPVVASDRQLLERPQPVAPGGVSG